MLRTTSQAQYVYYILEKCYLQAAWSCRKFDIVRRNLLDTRYTAQTVYDRLLRQKAWITRKESFMYNTNDSKEDQS